VFCVEQKRAHRAIFFAYYAMGGFLRMACSLQHETSEALKRPPIDTPRLSDIVSSQPLSKVLTTSRRVRPIESMTSWRVSSRSHNATYSSWLNRVKLCNIDPLSLLVASSRRYAGHLRYIRRYNKVLRTVKWKYADPSRQTVQNQLL
jgi:hypothetical protein